MTKLAKVYVDLGILSLDKAFDYEIPDELAQSLKIGHLIKVPFGKQKKYGVVTGFSYEKSDFRLRKIIEIIDETPIGEKELDLAFFMQNEFCAPFFDCLRLFCPPGVFAKEDKIIRLIKAEDKVYKKSEENVLSYLMEVGETTLSALKNEFGAGITRAVGDLCKSGEIVSIDVSKKSVSELTRKAVRLVKSEEVSDRAKKQAELIKALKKGNLTLTEIDEMGLKSAVTPLKEKGIVEVYDETIRRNPFKADVEKTYALSPTEEQKNALSELGKGGKFLIHGVTGSGKTEVYMQLIEKMLKKGKSAIVLVPEISLTPQMTNRFRSRFGDTVAILHSVLSQGERLDEWMRIKRGEAKVIIGARSAIFAPCSDIGVIIVDEEHENTYKSDTSPRYDARIVADERAKEHGATLILASATPDVVSYQKALSGEYTLIKMTKRYNETALPQVFIEDMRSELKKGNRSMLSYRLQDEILKNLENKEQTILFLNRRGFSTFVSCRSCGYVETCPECNVSLTYHKNTETLDCHFCGYRKKVKKVCPSCGSKSIRHFGTGTEKLEEEIKKLFPDATTIRMDVDTTSHKGAHEEILTKFAKEKIDILLGTQMVSKGLDFPDITLVGVVAADMSLNVDDFRASERTFDLITQVTGRAGRKNKRGRAIIQTYAPENEVILTAKRQNYEEFFENEIAFRQMFSYPPFSDIVLVTFSGENEELTKKSAVKMEDLAKTMLKDKNADFFRVSPSPVARIKGRYRYRFWLKVKADTEIKKILKDLYLEHKEKEVRMTIDINPSSML